MNAMKKSGLSSGKKISLIIYWIATTIIVLETATGSVWDILRIPLVSKIITGLGYPAYILTIMGIWKFFGAVALVIPRFPRVKAWAYAGLFFIYTGAAVSNFATGHISDGWGPLIFAAITVVSWALRPVSRRVNPELLTPRKEVINRKNWKVIVYWTTVVILVLVMLSGGSGEIFHLRGYVKGAVNELGYPLYFLTILGTWKILGGIALLLPRFYLLKEWAYAGIFFDMTGAAASNIAMGNPVFHIIIPLIFAGLVVLSWAFRPYVR